MMPCSRRPLLPLGSLLLGLALLAGCKSVNDMPVTEQTERSMPFYQKAVESERKGLQGLNPPIPPGRSQKFKTAEPARRTYFDIAAGNYKKVWKKYPSSLVAAQSLFSYGEIKFSQGKWRRADRAFIQVLERHPEYPRFNDTVRYIFDCGTHQADGDGVRFLKIIPYKAYSNAVEAFEGVIYHAPYSDLAPLALMNVAMIHHYRGDIPEAIDALDRMINNYPGSTLTDSAYLELAETYADLVDGPEYDQGSTREAMSYFQDFIILFPENEGVKQSEERIRDLREIHARSKLLTGEFYYRHRNMYRASEIFFNEAVTIGPETKAAVRAKEYLAKIEEFKELAKQDPNYRFPATTWGQRILFWRSRPTDLAPEGTLKPTATTEADAGAARNSPDRTGS